MSWKDYFFFQKGDKIAILMLMILIVLSGIAYVATLPKEKSIDTNTFAEEFETFQATLQDKDTITFSGSQIYKGQSQNNPRYNYPAKLSQGETIELNEADTTTLKKIPGIGSGYANRIVKYRDILGGYADILQLKEVWGMDDDLYEKICAYIVLTPNVKKIRINTASFDELNKHPYINYKQATIITDIRERKGNIESINRISLLDEFTPKDIKRLAPYLSFN